MSIRRVLWICLFSGLLSACHTLDYEQYDEEANAWAQSQPQLPASVYQPRPAGGAPIAAHTDPYIVEVPGVGSVRGRPHKFIKNRRINAYLGLKYAHVGNGVARFQKATVPRQVNADSIIDATQVPDNCPQFPDLEQIMRNEANGINVDDCLTLNIHVPAQARSLPVIVFVHGEMLFDGSAEEGQPDYFLEHDVLLVSVNYRLAPFGFLTTLTDELPGNVALSDIQLALEWIQRNIRYFGGNPAQVTLIGQAGGATLVHALSISRKANGLFHKVILQSGTALNPYFIDENPLQSTRSFAYWARCPIGYGPRGLTNLHSCLQRMSTSELLNVFKRYWEDSEGRGLVQTGGFKLVIGDRLGYLPQHPAALVANNAVPVIAGVTKDAGAFIMSRFYAQLEALNSSNITDYIDVVLKHTAPVQQHQLWRHWALTQIFSPEDARAPNIRSLSQGLLELVNLILYRSPVVDAIRYTFKNHTTYLYCFDYRGEYHRFSHLENPLPFGIDATLSDDNIYLFPYPEDVSQLNPEDQAISRAITTMWVNFAQYGIPNLNPGVWPNVTNEYGPFLRITNSRDSNLEIDYHFGEGIPVPNQYPQYFTTTTSTTTTSTTTSTTPASPRYDNNAYEQYYRQHSRPPVNAQYQQEQRKPYNYQRYAKFGRRQVNQDTPN